MSEPAINTFKALQRANRPPQQDYTVWAYFVAQDLPGNPKAYVINLGNYATVGEATSRAETLIELTGHPQIFATKAHQWEPLTTEARSDRITFVSVGIQRVLEQKHREEQQKLLEAEKRHEELQKEISEEHQARENPESLEAFMSNWYVLIKTHTAKTFFEQKLAETTQNFETRLQEIKSAVAVHPEYAQTWLPTLKEKLSRRDELNIFEAIEKAVPDLESLVLLDV